MLPPGVAYVAIIVLACLPFLTPPPLRYVVEEHEDHRVLEVNAAPLLRARVVMPASLRVFGEKRARVDPATDAARRRRVFNMFQGPTFHVVCSLPAGSKLLQACSLPLYFSDLQPSIKARLASRSARSRQKSKAQATQRTAQHHPHARSRVARNYSAPMLHRNPHQRKVSASQGLGAWESRDSDQWDHPGLVARDGAPTSLDASQTSVPFGISNAQRPSPIRRRKSRRGGGFTVVRPKFGDTSAIAPQESVGSLSSGAPSFRARGTLGDTAVAANPTQQIPYSSTSGGKGSSPGRKRPASAPYSASNPGVPKPRTQRSRSLAYPNASRRTISRRASAGSQRRVDRPPSAAAAEEVLSTAPTPHIPRSIVPDTLPLTRNRIAAGRLASGALTLHADHAPRRRRRKVSGRVRASASRVHALPPRGQDEVQRYGPRRVCVCALACVLPLTPAVTSSTSPRASAALSSTSAIGATAPTRDGVEELPQPSQLSEGSVGRTTAVARVIKIDTPTASPGEEAAFALLQTSEVSTPTNLVPSPR